MSYADRLSDSGVAIFLFHGVVRRHQSRIRNYTRKHIDVDTFASVLRDLRASGASVTMDEVYNAARAGGGLPPKAFAITFDDGFANNLHVAAPVLADMRIPATFYITTDFVARNQMSWVDRIEAVLEPVERATLRLPWGVRHYENDVECIGLLDEIRARIKTDPTADGHALADEIQRQLGCSLTYASDHPLDQKLNWDEVSQLAANPDFIVAGHSHTHPILEYLADDALKAEIATSLQLLKDCAGIESSHYAYPEGLSYCYSDRVISALMRHGILCCPSAEDGINKMPADPFRLKRIFVT